MSENDTQQGPANSENVTPDDLLRDVRKSSFLAGGIFSVVLHVVVIGLTSIAFIANGFREPEPPKKEEKPAAAAAQEGETPDADAEKPAEDDDDSAGAKQNGDDGDDGGEDGAQTADKPAGDPDKPTTEEQPPDGINTQSPTWKAVNDVAKPDEIMREPDTKQPLNLEMDDEDLLRDALKTNEGGGEAEEEDGAAE